MSTFNGHNNSRLFQHFPDFEPHTSWWVHLDRAQFAIACREQVGRMRLSKFGQIGETIYGAEPKIVRIKVGQS